MESSWTSGARLLTLNSSWCPRSPRRRRHHHTPPHTTTGWHAPCSEASGPASAYQPSIGARCCPSMDVCRWWIGGLVGLWVGRRCNDGVSGSNTYFFELFLNWKGVCVEGDPDKYAEIAVKANRSSGVNWAVVGPSPCPWWSLGCLLVAARTPDTISFTRVCHLSAQVFATPAVLGWVCAGMPMAVAR